MGIWNVFENCFWFPDGGENKRNALSSMLAGLLFFLGWWLVIDAAAVHPGELSAAHHVCGIFGTISLFMVNAVSNSQIRDDTTGGCMGSRGSRIWLFVGFVLGFASLIAAVWIMVAEFASGKPDQKDTWVGVNLVMQNVLIFFASVVFKFGRQEDPYNF